MKELGDLRRRKRELENNGKVISGRYFAKKYPHFSLLHFYFSGIIFLILVGI